MGNEKILVVDDEYYIRDLLKKSLSKEGYEVIDVENGVLAIELVEREKFDLVISDIRMPKMSGMELFRRIRSEFPDLPVILVTGYADIEGARKALKEGAVDYISKPFKLEELLKSVHEAFERSKQKKTEAKKREELEKQVKDYSQRMKNLYEEVSKTGAMKDTFLNLISHEFRTPISKILAGADTLLAQGDMEKGKPIIDIVQRSGWRLNKIMDDIMFVTKASAGELNFEMKKEDLNEMIKSNLSGFESFLKEKKCALEFEHGESALTIKADRNMIVDCIMKLLDNSSSYKRDDNKIIIRTKGVKEGDKVKKAVLEVEDKGKGMSKEQVRTLMRPFEQAVKIKHHHIGLGLGLPICKLIAEKHGGKIDIDSEVGKGTTVRLEFPAVQ